MAERALPSMVGTLSEGVRPHVRLIGLLALSHMVIDINQGSIPALLPFLKTTHNLSYERDHA